jgi:hypothetical protein
MTEHKKPGVTFWATVVVVCLLPVFGYGGAYLYIVDIDGRWHSGPEWPTAYKVKPYYCINNYRDQEVLGWIFGPAHSIDRRIRRVKWTGER